MGNATALPLTAPQMGVWLDHQAAADAAFYNVAENLRIRGPLDTTGFARALQQVVDRTEALRIRIFCQDALPQQAVVSHVPCDLKIIDLRRRDDAEAAAREWMDTDLRRPFALDEGPLFRFVLFHVSAQCHLWYYKYHHVVADGAGMAILAGRVADTYTALQHETEARWTPNLAWADVVREDLAYTTSTQKMTDRDFWLSHCRDLPQPKSLSPRCDSVREPGRSRCTVAALSQSLLSRLHQLAQACPGGGCRLTHVLYALLHAYVARLTGESDIAMGVARAGRAAGPARATPGMFSTVMVPRIAFPQSGTLRELMATVTATLRACARHDRYPLQELVRELGILPTGRSKPFRVLFNFLPFSYDFRFCDAPVERESLPLQCWDLAFVVRENRQSRDGQLELHYAEDLYARSEIELHCERFLHLLQSAPDHLETPLCDLPLLRPSERARLVEWNAPAADYPRDKCVHQLFETQVEETPDGLAVVCEDQQLSYRELNARANQLAHHLRGLGVGPEVMVGLCLERSIELVVGILGIIKAGGAYVPLDPTYPRRRLEFMLRDTQAPVVLTQHHLAERLPPHAGAVIRLDADGPGIARQDASNPESTAGPDSLVYVMYTSGSTGEPKGTCIEHRGVVRLVKNTNYVELTPREVLLQLASISFDASTFEIWGALLNGARLVVFPPDTPSLRELGTFIRARGITTLLLTTPLFHQMVDSELASLAGVRQLLTGGDVLSVRHAQQVLDTLGDRRLINGYGPTENTTFTCCHVMTCNSTIENTVPIGRPISNTRVYVLDEQRRPVPIGVWGELYIGGDGLARGYLNQPRLTEEKFVPDPFSEEVSSRLYRSGDIVRWQGDGALEFRGREDHQVKIHGYRVELAEIESALSAERQVREAVVVARDDGSGGKRLVAYIVPSVGEDGQAVSLSVSQLRAYLGERLPEYMIPAAFVYLHSLPLTANGKVDRRNLPAPEGRRQLEGEYVPPRTPVEEQLCAIWQQQLGLDRVGVHDNFFKLGGHSLMVMQLVFRIAKELQTELAMRDVFAHPTIAQLALLISRDADEAELPSRQRIKPVAGHRGLPLSYSQERLWFLHSFAPDQANNISAAYRLCGPLQVAALEQSLDEIIRRQESLRTTISASEGIPVQSIAPHEPFRLTVSDVSHLSEAERKATLEQLLTAEAEHIFDLDRGPLFRARLVCLGPSEHMFQLTVHHIVFDGWSLGLFRRELATLYRAFRTGRPSPLADLSIRYADFAVWQRARLQGERRATQLDYWKRQLGGAPPALELPSDRPRPSIQTHRGAHQHVFLSRDLSDLLQTLSQQEGVTLFMTLLTAFQLLLHRLAGQDDIVVGTPIAGRAAIETEKLIGLFLNNLVLRTDFSGNPPFRDALARVRRVALDAYAHQDIPFETLVEELRVERDLSRTPLFQVFFNMLTLEEQPFDLPGLSIEPLSFGRPRANFDLTLYVRESPHGISLDLVYNSDLFDRVRMVELLAQFRHLLTQIAEHPEREISAFSLVTDDSRTILPDPRVLLDEPKYELVPTRFCNQANARPAQVAVLQDERIWTYGELADRARRLAQVLLTEEDERGEVVAVTGPSSFGLIASMLGVMLSGRVLLTLDENLPERRQQLMLREARARRMIAVGRPHDEQGCEIGAPLTIIDVDPDTGDAVRRDQDVSRQSLPLPALAPDDAAYVFFTSGTAGVPKGVVGSHKGLAHFLHWQQQTFEIGPRDRIAQMTGLSFDVVLREIFLPLTSGATLCLPPRDAPWEPARMFEWMDGQQISILHAVPALAESWLINVPTGFSLRTLRWLFLAGEPLTDALVRRWRDAFPEAGQIVNLYGPTETTLAKCFYRVPDQIPAGIQPVGLPQPATQALLLRENGHLCGIGEPGEIVIRTPFRSLGYLNAPAENRRAFVQNPFRDDPHDLVYRTGDRGRYRPDGLLEILGRLDDQLKIRGVRIEPGEIAAVLGQHPGIKQVFVMAYEEVAAEKGKRVLC